MAKSTQWSITEVVQEGWQIYKKNWQLFLKVFGTIFLVSLVDEYLPNMFGEGSIVTILFSLALGLVSMLLGIGMLNIILKLVRGENTEYNQLFEYRERFIPYLLGNLAYGVIIVLGFILLILPGIYAALRFTFVPYLLATTKMSVTEAFEASTKMTEGEKLHILGFSVALMVLNILGFIALFVGAYFTIAATIFASALVFDRLLPKAKN